VQRQRVIQWIASLKNYFKYRSTRQWFSVVILAAFTALIVPREWIHHCTHKTTIDSDHTHFDDGACYLCDFQLGTCHSPKIIRFHFLAISNDCAIWNSCEKESNESIQHQELRGPPCLI
jgi:hypothetical protein